MSTVIPQWLRHRNRAALAAGVLGAAALAMGTTASLGGFTASITNTGDKAQTGDLIMQEATTPTGGTTTTCLSTGTGTAITTNANAACAANKFGALTNSVPGATSASVVVVTNQGSLPAATFTLGAAGCVATGTAPPGATATNVGSDTAGFCSKVDVTSRTTPRRELPYASIRWLPPRARPCRTRTTSRPCRRSSRRR